LRRLQTDHVDVYFNHAINDVERIKNPQWHEFTDLAKKQGKIRFAGMSGHAGRLIECLDWGIDSGHFDVILCAYNFGQDPRFYSRFFRSFDFVAIQSDLPRVIKKAKAKGVGVIAMKTLRGGRLNDMRPYEKDGATFAQAAFRWVLSNSDVDALIVTMTSTAAIDEYLGASGARATAAADIPLLQRYERPRNAARDAAFAKAHVHMASRSARCCEPGCTRWTTATCALRETSMRSSATEPRHVYRAALSPAPMHACMDCARTCCSHRRIAL
jgi:predicted aldo/keto reductase-like oxidoreductase